MNQPSTQIPDQKRPTMKRIEMKFRLDDCIADQVAQWAREHMDVDPNCHCDDDDRYQVCNLYLDSPELDLLRATGRVGRTKHRIRRYGNESSLWLETKRKKRMVVKKRRSSVVEADFYACCGAAAYGASGGLSVFRGESAVDAVGDHWFSRRVFRRGLQPTVHIAYRRFARTAQIDGQTVRLTIDDGMTASPADGWTVPHASGFRPDVRFGNGKVLELKFHGILPLMFKDLLRTFTIPASGFSKYRHAMQALAASRGEGSMDSQVESLCYA
ncbi:polyphosphate polymerase domain-containing protein [Crateriforma spongiae]|uniref:polyphosphate polymerase domain-containing protein n=1 Tax=Crateriforma spongiae TaxID=2724528 RepID=UPI00144751FA|nr:polyphosphate polymerase domain-containing protein [Crateriforma spongiae]